MMYNHAVSLSFSFDSKNDSESLGEDDIPVILDALKNRLMDLSGPDRADLLSAIEIFDTYALEV